MRACPTLPAVGCPAQPAPRPCDRPGSLSGPAGVGHGAGCGDDPVPAFGVDEAGAPRVGGPDLGASGRSDHRSFEVIRPLRPPHIYTGWRWIPGLAESIQSETGILAS